MTKKSEYLSSIRELSKADLERKIIEEKNKLKNMEFAHAITPLESPISIRNKRRDIARLKTVLNTK